MANILSHIKSEHLFVRIICLIVGCFFITLIYNLFFVPNNIVAGGVSGLAILIKELFGLSTTIFINLSNVILVILSFMMLGKRKTFDQLIGCIVYTIMLNITAPIAKSINFTFESEMIMIIIASILYGISNGIVYRAGYSTGGTDFLSQILSEKLKKPMTQMSLIFQVCIITASTIVFGIHKVMLAIFIIYVSNRITNALLFGVSTSKMVYVVSKKYDDIENFVIHEIDTGATELKVESGIFGRKKRLLLCVIHNAQYPRFKHEVLSLDKDAFILANNCYEVSGGRKFNILPF
ncbi:MAG: YitT family protein [Bacilli bacterium]|nr:YitT family protein [Bacilli bacterium]